jgi:threonine/homoserine/homoserine lactone efflux protein
MMKASLQIFYWGMLISFLGSLPPGIMNIAATQIAGRQGTMAGLVYASGSMLAEVIIVRIALSGLTWLTTKQKLFQVLEWMTAVLLIVFSITCFVVAGSMQDFTGILPKLVLPPFITGVVISAVNPLHIPFWLGWSTVLINKGILLPDAKRSNIYIAGIGIGTIAGFMVFIAGGQYLLKAFQANQYLINSVMGTILFIVAYLHIRKIIIEPASVRYAGIFRRI